MDAPQTSHPSARTGSTRAWGGHPARDRPGLRPDVGTPERSNRAVLPAEPNASVPSLAGLGRTPAGALTFRSILVPPEAEGLAKETSQEPEFFRDLNLDKIVAAITAGKDDYNLRPLFYSPIRDLATIEYRHEVMRDLEHDDILQTVSVVRPGYAEHPPASCRAGQASLRTSKETSVP